MFVLSQLSIFTNPDSMQAYYEALWDMFGEEYANQVCEVDTAAVFENYTLEDFLESKATQCCIECKKKILPEDAELSWFSGVKDTTEEVLDFFVCKHCQGYGDW